MKSTVQIVCAIALMVLIGVIAAQRPSCWEDIKNDPENIDQVFYPHESNCQYYYQCSMHGPVRMKCQHGMHFDQNTHQCGRPDDVDC